VLGRDWKALDVLLKSAKGVDFQMLMEA